MKRRLDIDGISEILAGDDTREKIEALEELERQLPEWDIFPVSMLLPGLADPNAEVRARTFSLLRYYCQWRREIDPVWRRKSVPSWLRLFS